ncbi:ATP synthase subunit b, mitochondrial-like [Trichoplusia ni]|uniref:ATP synthase subunit b n=1 Tax=Trichoplusia ni TaxID=7111 RepID=A0A7E5VH96_TRINI|nr:ATP synthase subunit b, mitochondrial-like [Trichoplusia ni]
MLSRHIVQLRVIQPRLLVSLMFGTHSKTCPANKPKVCPGAGGLKKKGQKGIKGIKGGGVCDGLKRGSVSGGAEGESTTGIKRALKPGKCRMGLIPEEWFLFFKPMTGVSGPYIFMLVLGNYLVSKEIFIMEHEYYLGLSIATVLYIITTRFGKLIGQSLDKGVDAIANEYEKTRNDEIAEFKKIASDAAMAKWRAEGQKELMDAKKENIAMQLEAFYRERVMSVYQQVRGRMEYHVKRHKTITRIHQRWMVKWIMAQVHKSITPQLKQQALANAIQELNAIAAKVK